MSPAGSRTDPARRILVTDGEFKHAVGIVRSLRKRGSEIHVLARSRRAPSVHSRGVAAWHKLPPAADPTFAEGLLRVVRELAPVSVVLVGSDAHAAGIRLRSTWPEHARVALPSDSAFKTACDKVLTADLARELGVQTPRERTTSSSDEAAATWREFGPRLVVKARREMGRKVLRYARTEDEARRAHEEIQRLSGTPPLVQEFVSGEGCGFSALYWRGRCVRRFMHRRIREWPPSGGTSAAAESIRDCPELERNGRALLDALAWHGVAMVEFKHDRGTGRFVLMEINAKFWGSMELAVAAGVDFPADLVACLEGEDLPPQREYREIRFTWPLGGDLLHGLARPASLPRVLVDALSPAVAGNFCWSDPIPTVYEALQWARALPGAWREFRETR